MGHPEEWLSFIRFRNPGSTVPLIFQCCMLLCSVLVLIGIFCVILLVLAITFHHLIFDRDPNKVPDFVKRSIQFESESEGSDDDCFDDDGGKKKGLGSLVPRSNPYIRKGSYDAESSSSLNLQSKRAHVLDKFLKKDIDVNKK